VTTSRDGAGSDEPVETLRRGQRVGLQDDSRLRSVFLQWRLIAGLPVIAGVDPAAAKAVVQGIVDRLLQVRGGLDPLILLERDGALLQRSTAVAVLTVVFARCAGWPTQVLPELGVAGLLHDLGSVLDQDNPGQAAFRWLLDRGEDDLWLRSALVARHVGTPATAAEVGLPGQLAVVGLVRLAASTDAAGADVEARERSWRDSVAVGGVAAELLDAARHALA
jgi:hypothetical protein